MRRRGWGFITGSSANLLLAVVGVALMATVVRGVYQLPQTISVESKIRAGALIPDREIPAIAEAIAMRQAAEELAGRTQTSKEIRQYASRFGIDHELARMIYDISVDEAIDPELIFRIVWVESQFKQDCVGTVGEIGLMQVRYSTAVTIDPGATRNKLFDPAYNIRMGIKHLKDHLHFYRGDTRLALLAYNRGRGRVNELLTLGLNPSNGYARKVLETNL
ncbi:MAG: transglycosylase SLT domain-containing protein [Candidatus Glassbacteria bacterium]